MKNYNFYVKKTITSGSSHDPAVVASTSSYSTWLRTVVKTENFPFSKKKNIDVREIVLLKLLAVGNLAGW